jgi:hypothetical protein
MQALYRQNFQMPFFLKQLMMGKTDRMAAFDAPCSRIRKPAIVETCYKLKNNNKQHR